MYDFLMFKSIIKEMELLSCSKLNVKYLDLTKKFLVN